MEAILAGAGILWRKERVLSSGTAGSAGLAAEAAEACLQDAAEASNAVAPRRRKERREGGLNMGEIIAASSGLQKTMRPRATSPVSICAKAWLI